MLRFEFCVLNNFSPQLHKSLTNSCVSENIGVVLFLRYSKNNNTEKVLPKQINSRYQTLMFMFLKNIQSQDA